MKVQGIVKRNIGRGHTLGFPTANFELTAEIPDGIYVAKACVRGQNHPSLVFIGEAKTFGEHHRQAEVYILDFEGDLYGQKLEANILEKIRENEKFSSPEALVEQIKKDVQIAREYFKTHQNE